ncbi:MAG: hypothetical protein MJ067_06710 [Oscillospiraceae bacterium]|nr:hypothetical protein [Oscillospiraceae bacterium]
MPDYKRMYITLCTAVDNVIDELDRLPGAGLCAFTLRNALLRAEEIYIESSPAIENAEGNITVLKRTD